MTRLVIACIGALLASAASAQSTLVWRGEPSGTILSGPTMAPTARCYPTLRRLKDGMLIYHRAECPQKAHNHLDLGVPLRGPVVNMRGYPQATRAKVTKNKIILY